MGLAVILAGSWTDIAVAAVLGAGVASIKQLAARRRLAIQVFLPVLCAFLVAAAVALLGRTAVIPELLPPILGALVTFIPGGLLTTAVIELATGQMISGASRFVYGSAAIGAAVAGHRRRPAIGRHSGRHRRRDRDLRDRRHRAVDRRADLRARRAAELLGPTRIAGLDAAGVCTSPTPDRCSADCCSAALCRHSWARQ